MYNTIIHVKQIPPKKARYRFFKIQNNAKLVDVLQCTININKKVTVFYFHLNKYKIHMLKLKMFINK